MYSESVNEWLTIEGKRIQCEEFIQALDDQRFRLPRNADRDAFASAINILQDCTEEYQLGATSVTFDKEFFDDDGVDYPSTLTYPEALQIIFNSIERSQRLDLSEMLDRAATRSSDNETKKTEEKEKKNKNHQVVVELVGNTTLPVKPDEKITFLLRLQLAKQADPRYDVTAKEKVFSELWCRILTHSLFGECIFYCDLKSLIEQGIINESDVTRILKHLGDSRDCEWYMEDFLSCDLLDETKIPNEVILDLVEPFFCRGLNI